MSPFPRVAGDAQPGQTPRHCRHCGEPISPTWDGTSWHHTATRDRRCRLYATPTEDAA